MRQRCIGLIVCSLLALPPTHAQEMAPIQPKVPTLHDLLGQAVRDASRFPPALKRIKPEKQGNDCDRWGCASYEYVDPLLDHKDVKRLESIGMIQAAHTLSAKLRFAKRAKPLYNQFPVLTTTQIETFNTKLREATERQTSWCLSFWKNTCERYESIWMKLEIVEAQHYNGVPPKRVLDRMVRLKDDVDSFHIAYLEEQSSRAYDPLLLGRVDGSSDYFVLDQWGEDLTYEEILALADRE